MLRNQRFFLLLSGIMLFCLTGKGQDLYPRKAYAGILLTLTDALLHRQVTDGGIWCETCHVWHTRAAEAVYPFTVAAEITGQEKYKEAALLAADWLFKQQQINGSWKETPEEWTGTTTDQLLMLLLSYQKLALTAAQKRQWQTGMTAAAEYLYRVMDPEFASINYVATTTATLALAGIVLHREKYTQRATLLAHRTITKMDEDGFLNGEGGRSHNNKMGVDLGYDMEMSLWGLGLYARFTSDTIVSAAVSHAVANHLYFIYPDGSMDGSWGIRSNKWTGYGSATSDGCIALFTLFEAEDDRYATAALRNLDFIRQNILQDSLLGYGPQHIAVLGTAPCIYPTFAKAKNLALAYELETKEKRPFKAIPADEASWMRYWPTLDVIEVKTACFMATITGYRYKDQAAGSKGKYMFRPDGGTISHLWASGYGFMGASSPTIYTRPEPMSFPEAPGVLPLTPRIEYTDSTGYFTNLFEFDSQLSAKQHGPRIYEVTVSGELKDKLWLTGGVGYKIRYLFEDSAFQKTITIIGHDALPQVSIIEPVIRNASMEITLMDNQTVLLQAGMQQWRLSIISGNASWIAGRDAINYRTPYPALQAYPLELILQPSEAQRTRSVTYSIRLLNNPVQKKNE